MTKLERSWKNCLRMWKWIAEVYGTGEYASWTIRQLKREWLRRNRFSTHLTQRCFFCHHTDSDIDVAFNCRKCPGRLVSRRFDCACKTYHFLYKPKAFYKKLCQLAKKGGYERFI